MKVLLIDDEPNQSSWLCKRIESENNQTLLINDPQLAWTTTQQTQYDIVVLNARLTGANTVVMPKLCRAKTRFLPLLVLVSPDTPTNKAAYLEAGADDCVGHGTDFREVMARLYTLCRHQAGLLTSMLTLRVGALELNQVNRSACLSSHPIALLPREYRLLAYLMRHQGRIISKTELMENVWNKASGIRPNTVEVYINYLRNKIDRQFATKLIHTVAGMGYLIRVTD